MRQGLSGGLPSSAALTASCQLGWNHSFDNPLPGCPLHCSLCAFPLLMLFHLFCLPPQIDVVLVEGDSPEVKKHLLSHGYFWHGAIYADHIFIRNNSLVHQDLKARNHPLVVGTHGVYTHNSKADGAV